MAAKGIIIESGQHTRSLDTRSSQPKALDLVKSSNKHVIDWIVSSLHSNNIHDITYIGSYHIEKVIKHFPYLKFVYYTPQDAKNEVQALSLCNVTNEDDIVIIRSDMVILPDALRFETLSSIELFYTSETVAKDNLAMLYVPKSLTSSTFSYFKQNKINSFHDLNQVADFPITNKVLNKQAASVSTPYLLSQVIFQGKGKTLENIAPLLKKSKVLDQIRFSYVDWLSKADLIIGKIQSAYPDTKVVVRSNTKSEDSLSVSHAGAFLSLLDVPSNDRNALISSINQVMNSYSKDNRTCLDNDEILVQPQVENIRASGVLLTREPRTGSPYFVISIDSTSGRSDTVTSGTTEKIENYYVAWNAQITLMDTHIAKICDSARELLEIAPLDSLDIEFCIDHQENIYILQLRPQVLKVVPDFKDEEVYTTLNELCSFAKDKFEPKVNLAGKSTVLGVMPDWNPAEIIGITPKPLALSLYQRLVCNQAWAIAREQLGYKPLREPLIYSLGGAPYVDVRKSLNSLLPKDLDSAIAEAWTNYCIAKLKSEPYFHDKVEFEIYVTCLSPYWHKYEKRLQQAQIGEKDINSFYDSLHRLTTNIFDNYEEMIATQHLKLTQLIENIYVMNEPSSIENICKNIRNLIDEVIINGIIPFAKLARMAFISINYMRDFVELGVFSEAIKNQFLNAIPTVASMYTDDIKKFQLQYQSMDYLVEKYGHLRPNSYEITVDNYARNPAQYFQANVNNPISSSDNPIDILLPYAQTIEAVLSDINLKVTFPKLVDFLVKSISLREYAKFEFMKAVNLILSNISLLGEKIDLSNQQLSFLHIDDLLRYETDSLSGASIRHLLKTASFNQKKHSLLCGLVLPEVICDAKDVMQFKMGSWRPNFITLNKAIGEVVWLDSSADLVNLTGKIVCIEAADPGYDWIFGQNISGLITAFGGVASHMAIRSAEFNLPAAIGCGINQFNLYKNAKRIELNCQLQIIKVLE